MIFKVLTKINQVQGLAGEQNMENMPCMVAISSESTITPWIY